MEKHKKALLLIANSLSVDKDQYIKFYEAEDVDSDEPISQHLFNDSDDEPEDTNNDESMSSTDKRQNERPDQSEDESKPKDGNSRINNS